MANHAMATQLANTDPPTERRNTERPHYYDVSYFNALEGGSGQTRVSVATLHEWLDANPGILIRKLQPTWRL